MFITRRWALWIGACRRVSRSADLMMRWMVMGRKGKPQLAYLEAGDSVGGEFGATYERISTPGQEAALRWTSSGRRTWLQLPLWA